MAAATATLKRPHEETVDASDPRLDDDVLPQPAQHPAKRKKNGNVKTKHAPESTKYLPTQTEPRLQKVTKQNVTVTHPPDDIAIQIVVGSYDRVLHGITASVPAKLLHDSSAITQNGTESTSQDQVLLSDTFLLAPHTASIRCLALSPPTDNQKRLLATGSTDERIHLYSLSTKRPLPTKKSKPNPKTLTPLAPTTSTNPLNRPLGTLTHHTRPLTTLSFPTKTKLFTAAEDNTIAITRTRDWTLLSAIKAPLPTPSGRPSGDTATPSSVPAGVNDFAIHPSQKLMLSVGQGEKCMRLWNLMTGKKAGVLGFERDVLQAVGEGRWGRGEGRSVVWFAGGDGFVVSFERGFVVFGVDCKVRAVVAVGSRVLKMRVLDGEDGNVLGVSTEDGRVVCYGLEDVVEIKGKQFPTLQPQAQLGGTIAGVTNRVKDFEVLQVPADYRLPTPPYMLITANSDGAVRIWTLDPDELTSSQREDSKTGPAGVKQVGRLLATLETGNRITCLGAFIMDENTVQEQDIAGLDAESEKRSDDDGEGDDDDDDGEEDFEGFDDA